MSADGGADGGAAPPVDAPTTTTATAPSPLDPPVPPPSTVEAILQDYVARRHGLLTALTHDFDTLYAAADPAAPALCLAAGPDGAWSLAPPHPAVPPPLPEPCVGINFAKDGTSRSQWAAVLAAHSDAWLIGLASFFSGAAGLGPGERRALFDRINALDPLFDAVRAWAGERGLDGGCGGGGGAPAVARGGGSAPRPAGRPLTDADITPSLKGASAALFWPDDARWYSVQVAGVSPRSRTAQVRYPTGEAESLDLGDVMREGHMLLVD